MAQKLKERVLTESHLAELVELVNRELVEARTLTSQRHEALTKQVAQLQARLDRPYEALETDQFSPDDLAPRIRELRRQLQELQHRNEEAARPSEEVQLTRGEITRCALDLQTIMESGSISQRKTFLRSSIRKIVIPRQANDADGEIEYSLPLLENPSSSNRHISKEVLSAVQSGSPPSTKG